MDITQTAALVDRYVALWNEPDASERRRRIRELWSPDGAHFTRTISALGYDAIEARVAGAYERFVSNGLHTFRSALQPDAHNDVVRLHWRMMPVGGGAAAGGGMDFLMLGADGRIRVDYQFNDPSV